MDILFSTYPAVMTGYKLVQFVMFPAAFALLSVWGVQRVNAFPSLFLTYRAYESVRYNCTQSISCYIAESTTLILFRNLLIQDSYKT